MAYSRADDEELVAQVADHRKRCPAALGGVKFWESYVTFYKCQRTYQSLREQYAARSPLCRSSSL